MLRKETEPCSKVYRTPVALQSQQPRFSYSVRISGPRLAFECAIGADDRRREVDITRIVAAARTAQPRLGVGVVVLRLNRLGRCC